MKDAIPAPRSPRKSTTTAAPRAARPRASKRQATADAVTVPTADEIARRAYEIYLSRNGGPGDAIRDWLEAERELTGRK